MKPSSWVTVDEIMVKLSGRSEQIVNLKGKPASEGFEIWGFGFAGYVYGWLFHNLKEGPEGISKKKKFVVDQVIPLVAVTLAPTIRVIYIDGVTRRHPQQHFLARLDIHANNFKHSAPGV